MTLPEDLKKASSKIVRVLKRGDIVVQVKGFSNDTMAGIQVRCMHLLTEINIKPNQLDVETVNTLRRYANPSRN